MTAQNTKSVTVEYEQKMVVNEEKIAHFPESMKEIVRAKAKWKPALLVHTDKGSYYKLTNKIESVTVDKGPGGKSTAKTGQKIYFKDFKTSTSLSQIQMHNETILVKADINKYKWKLTSEEKVIDNITCKKATTINNRGQVITAWYTDKFGINNGPADYYGLPGLIVFAEGGLYSYKLNKVNFSKEAITLLEPIKGSNQITEEEYVKLYVNSKGNETQRGNRTTSRRAVKN